jgi:hypothetical protein
VRASVGTWEKPATLAADERRQMASRARANVAYL